MIADLLILFFERVEGYKSILCIHNLIVLVDCLCVLYRWRVFELYTLLICEEVRRKFIDLSSSDSQVGQKGGIFCRVSSYMLTKPRNNVLF